MKYVNPTEITSEIGFVFGNYALKLYEIDNCKISDGFGYNVPTYFKTGVKYCSVIGLKI